MRNAWRYLRKKHCTIINQGPPVGKEDSFQVYHVHNSCRRMDSEYVYGQNVCGGYQVREVFVKY